MYTRVEFSVRVYEERGDRLLAEMLIYGAQKQDFVTIFGRAYSAGFCDSWPVSAEQRSEIVMAFPSAPFADLPEGVWFVDCDAV